MSHTDLSNSLTCCTYKIVMLAQRRHAETFFCDAVMMPEISCLFWHKWHIKTQPSSIVDLMLIERQVKFPQNISRASQQNRVAADLM